MKTTSNFIKFLKKSKGNLIHFVDNKAVSVNGKIVEYLELGTNELNGFAVDRRKALSAVSILDECVEIKDDKFWACKENKKKAVLIEPAGSGVVLKGFLIKELEVEFYSRYAKAATYSSNDSTRSFLCGVYLDGDGAVVATDRRALIAWKADKRFATKDRNIIMQDKALLNLKVESIRLYDAHVEFETIDSIVYQVPFIKGDFPNYQKLLDGKNNSSSYVLVELKKDIIESLIIAQKFAKNDRFRQVTITNKCIKTAGDQPYVDEIELEHEINIHANVEYLNKCIADVDASLDNTKFLHYSRTKHVLAFEDDRKVLLLMQMAKED